MVKIVDEIKLDFIEDARKFMIKATAYERFASEKDKNIIKSLIKQLSIYIDILVQNPIEEVE
jgi:hypothetical protein